MGDNDAGLLRVPDRFAIEAFWRSEKWAGRCFLAHNWAMGRGSAGTIPQTYHFAATRTNEAGEREDAVFTYELCAFEWLALEALGRLESQHPGKGHKNEAIAFNALVLRLGTEGKGCFGPEEAEGILSMMEAKEMVVRTASGADEYGKLDKSAQGWQLTDLGDEMLKMLQLSREQTELGRSL